MACSMPTSRRSRGPMRPSGTVMSGSANGPGNCGAGFADGGRSLRDRRRCRGAVVPVDLEDVYPGRVRAEWVFRDPSPREALGACRDYLRLLEQLIGGFPRQRCFRVGLGSGSFRSTPQPLQKGGKAPVVPGASPANLGRARAGERGGSAGSRNRRRSTCRSARRGSCRRP
jgi:hypothetical protein